MGSGFKHRELLFGATVPLAAASSFFFRKKREVKNHENSNSGVKGIAATTFEKINPSISYSASTLLGHFSESKQLVENNFKNKEGYEVLTSNADAIARIYSAIATQIVSPLTRLPIDWVFKLMGAEQSPEYEESTSAIKTLSSHYGITASCLVFRRPALHAAHKVYLDALVDDYEHENKYGGDPFKIPLWEVLPKISLLFFKNLGTKKEAKEEDSEISKEEIQEFENYRKDGVNPISYGKALIDITLAFGSYFTAAKFNSGIGRFISNTMCGAMIEGNSLATRLKDSFKKEDIIPAEERANASTIGWTPLFLVNWATQELLKKMKIDKIFKSSSRAGLNLRELVANITGTLYYMFGKAKLQKVFENYLLRTRGQNRNPIFNMIRWYQIPSKLN